MKTRVLSIARRISRRAPFGLLVLLGAAGTAAGSASMNRGTDTEQTPAAVREADTWLVYFGTYTAPGKSRGIYVASFDAATGKPGVPRLVAEAESPSFLALHPTRPLLYAVNELDNFGGQPAGSVSTFAIDAATGDLRELGRVSSRGAHPCHLIVDRTGEYVLVANYTGGSVASFALRPDGSLEAAAKSFVQHAGASIDPKRQKGPHAHMIATDPANRHALVADLGLDQLLMYTLDSGRLTLAATPPTRVAPGSGPRHFAFSPDPPSGRVRAGKDLYVLNEMSLTITAFRYEASRLNEFQSVSALPASVKPGPADSGAEIEVHPSGRFVYASVRGQDSLAVFARDGATGRLALLEHVPSGGRTPRSFVIDPTGRFLLAANQQTDQVVVFRIDPETGRLKPTGEVVGVGAPVSMSFFRASGPR
jgi:6-phosphogluconolactonase